MSRGLALDRGVDGEDEFGDAALGNAADQRLDVEIVRADAIERRQRAAEHVVFRVHRAGAFQRPEVRDILDDNQGGAVAARVGADRAGIDRVDIAADRAFGDLVDRLGERGGERTHQLVLLLDHVQRGAAGRAGAEPRHLGQKLDQSLDFGSGDSLCGHARDVWVSGAAEKGKRHGDKKRVARAGGPWQGPRVPRRCPCRPPAHR